MVHFQKASVPLSWRRLLQLLLVLVLPALLLTPRCCAGESTSSADAVSYLSFGQRILDTRQQQQQQQQQRRFLPETEEALSKLMSRGFFRESAERLLADLPSLEAVPAAGVFDGAEDVAGTATAPQISACANHTIALLRGLLRGDGWALRFLDSDAKPPAAIAYGGLLWLGNYDQCMAGGRSEPIKSPDIDPNSVQPLRGSYCLLSVAETGTAGRANGGLQSSALRLGLCMPDSCSTDQVANLTRMLLAPLQLLMPANHSLAVVPQAIQCHVPRSQLPWTAGAIAMTCLLCIFLVLIVVGTICDFATRYRVRCDVKCIGANKNSELLINETDAATAGDESEVAASDGVRSNGYGATVADGGAAAAGADGAAQSPTADNKDSAAASKPPIILRLLLCFSAYSNALKIVDVSHSEGTLTCIHGLRFLSMSWVILGHTYYFAFGSLNNLGQLYTGWQNDWTFQVIANATVSVDSFFVLSGLLSTFLFFRELRRVGDRPGRVNWVMFYLHRYWRLTPPYMLVMATYVCLFQFVYEGPMYPQTPSGIDPLCPNDWWKNALYINNLFNSNGAMCMAWSWYLANDMQFYIVSPLLFLLFVAKPALGIGATSALLLASVSAMGVHSTLNHLEVGFFGIAQEFNGIYIKPWFRAPAYLVGVLAGYLLHRMSGRSWRPHRLVIVTGWLVAAGLALSVVYGLYDVDGGRVSLPQGVASLYNAVYRPVWAAAVAWVAIACVTGNGGWVNGFLSQPLFAPLSRLTYCAYLVHPVVMLAYYLSRRQAMVWDTFSVVHAFLANSLIAYMAAFLASLAFEAPLIGLEKVLRGR